MVLPPPTDPITELAKMQMYENSVKKIKKLLDDNRACYHFNDGLFKDHHNFWCHRHLTVYISNNSSDIDDVEWFNVFIQPQLSLRCSKKAPRGYIICNLNAISRNFSRAEASNSLYCCYSLEEDVMMFKPMSFLLKYCSVSDINRTLANKRKGYVKEHYVRVDPKPKEPIKTEIVNFGDKGGKAAVTAKPIKKEPPFAFHLGFPHNSFVIVHNEATIIKEEEMSDFLGKSNCYPDAWKLKFKVAKNILSRR